ncbi:hypothetical protein [aff. Roholtiella sp. LEGE 12411]|uniref:hypothetical protein n=1 Tax=aff. Roholtiella sp. LEGE 12411 TaxID=1828822 RepID=UPI001880F3F2|nr:hypothetical protein [aff. Roholtiella sp. LEGE 12411]MBE9035187.1 hypothetical protein [aff. Roholtiella sp. LEGE 12411]
MTEYKTFVIRLKVKKGSEEERLLEFLNNDQARPFSKPQMILLALKAFWLTLSLSHYNEKIEQLLASLNQGTYLWKLQEQYLRKIVGIESTSVDSQEDKTPSKPPVSTLPPEQPAFHPFGDIVSIK